MSLRGKEIAARRDLYAAIPEFYRVLGMAQQNRRSGFIDPTTGFNCEDMPAELANNLVTAISDIAGLYEAYVHELENQTPAKTRTRKDPAQRMADIRQAVAELTEELGRAPSQREIGNKTGISQSRVQSLMKEMNNGE